MTQDHDAIDELLAGYVLRSLSGSDAAEADRLLTEHVPGCPSCHENLESFGAVVADLALDPSPIDPPATLLPRLHREMEHQRRRSAGSWRAGRFVAVAASLAIVVGLGGLALTRGGGVMDPTGQLANADLRSALEFAMHDGARTTAVGPTTQIAVPGVSEFYLYGSDVPQPPPGAVYRLWVVSSTETRYLGDFLPTGDGTLVLHVALDPARWDRLFVTAEPTGSEPAAPGQPAW